MYENFWKFSPDHFYDENFQFYDKKTDFRPGMEISSETTIPGISSDPAVTESRVIQPLLRETRIALADTKK